MGMVSPFLDSQKNSNIAMPQMYTESTISMLVTDEDMFFNCMEIIEAADTLAVDTETFGLRIDQQVQIGTVIAVKRDGLILPFYFPWRHKTRNLDFSLWKFLQGQISAPDKTIVFHNAKFDMRVLERDGCIFYDNWYDILVIAHLLDENRFNYGLKEMARDILGADTREDKPLHKAASLLGGYEIIPPEAMVYYAAKDGTFTFRLWEILYPRLVKETELLVLWSELRAFSKAIQEIETQGLRVDTFGLSEAAKVARAEQREIRDRLGYDPLKRTALKKRLVDELGLKPPRTAAGNYTFDESWLLSQINSSSEVAEIIRYRKLDKAASVWYEGWIEKADNNGRIHPSFKLHGTKTGRLSCEEPNLQQVPREEHEFPVKIYMLASEGYELWEADYSQMEFRLAAAYGNEVELISGFSEGLDAHSITANRMRINRQAGKTLNFSILYGGGIPTIVRQLGLPYTINSRGFIDSPAASELLDEYRNLYPGIFRVSSEAASLGRQQGFVKLWSGRQRHFQWPKESRLAWNSLIQGGCAEILRVSLVNLFNDPDFSGRVISIIHDSALIELPVGDVDRNKEIVRHHFCDWSTEGFGVPFVIDWKLYDN
jgi:DNA polymerase-1